MRSNKSDRPKEEVAPDAGSSGTAPLGETAWPNDASGENFSAAQRIIAELASDWAFIIRLEPDGTWELEWIAGHLPSRPGLDLEALDPELWDAYIVGDDQEVVVAHFSRAVEHGADRAEYRLELPEAGICWVESSLRSVCDDGLSPTVRVYGTMRDITERRVMEESLRESEGRYRALVEQASEGILLFDDHGRIKTSNAAAQDLFGLSSETLTTKLVSELFHPEDLDRDPLALHNLAAGMTLRSVRRVRREGQSDWAWAELSARQLGDGWVQATIHDISSRIDAEERIRTLAYFDTLTSLPNRDLFGEQMEAALERARRGDKQLALLFVDIDRFKQVNDSMGHSMGDELLQVVADRLLSAVRGSDTVSRPGHTPEHTPEHRDSSGPVSRLGGDEFTILVQDVEHPQDAARVARRVLHALSRPVEIGGREIFAGASIGISVWPEDGDGSEALLRSADVAMYHAKRSGGNRYKFFSPGMSAASSERLTLESKLRRALERNEFHVMYQPIRDSASGRVTAAEALIRWTDSEGNMIPPDQFIPIAEETGQIVAIGEWVLRTACRQAAQWQADGFEAIRMSVNLSVEQLREPAIAAVVDQVLFDTGLSPSDLELEITESSILDESPNIIAAVGQLTDMGITFALDDFGTGYSSLSALQRFPIDRLKIDRSFVSGVGERASDEALTSAILALARRLDLKVVAEGVETEEQARFLTELACDELQGYLLSRPLLPEDFGEYLRRSAKTEVAAPEGPR